MTRSRIIGKERASAAEQWKTPPVERNAVDALRGAASGTAHLLTAGQIDSLQRQAQEEAAKRGYEDGIAAGKAEVAARIERLTALTRAVAQPFRELEQAVEDEVVRLAVALAAHLVRREIAHDPALLRAAVHDCMAVLATGVRDVTIHFNPDDAVLVRTHGEPNSQPAFAIAVDPELPRGDLRVVTASSLVDGSLIARCTEIIAAVRATQPLPE